MSDFFSNTNQALDSEMLLIYKSMLRNLVSLRMLLEFFCQRINYVSWISDGFTNKKIKMLPYQF